MDLNEKLDLVVGVKHKGNQYFKVQSHSFTSADDFVLVHMVINCFKLSVIRQGDTTRPSSSTSASSAG